MLLNTLSIQAFGPFKKLFTIDFEKLNNSGIFLLTGETGVGKTSIFDAITYALYGDICGTNQDLERVRSSYASESDPTFVELTFEINNKQYTIRREPQQSLLNKGGKVVTRPHFVLLKYDDKSIIGPKEVSKKITELLGLTVNQFRQIVMIPQGEFMKLLTSSSEEKVKIFRQIFKTEELLKFEDIIRDKAKELYHEVSEVKTIIDTKIESLVDVDKSLSYDLKVEKIKEVIDTIKNKRDALQKEYDELSKLCDEFNKNLNEKQSLNKRIDEYNLNKNEYKNLLFHKEEIEFKKEEIEKSTKAYKVKVIYDKIDEINKCIKEYEEKIAKSNMQIDNCNILLKQNEDKHIDLSEQKLEYNQNKEKLINVKNAYKQLDECNRINNELEEYSIKISKVKKRLSEIRILKSNLEYQIETLENSIKDMNEIIYNESDYTSKNLVLESIIKKFELYKQYIKENDSIENDLNKITDSITEALKKEYDIDDKITNIKRKLLEDKAYVLALELKEGEPCPVCGSLRHPKMALPSDIEVNDEMIINLEKEKIELKQNANELVQEKSSLFNKKKYIESLIDSLNIEYSEEEYLKKSNELNEVKALLDEIIELKDKRDEKLDKKLSLDNEYKEIIEEEQDLNNKLIESMNKIEILNARLELLNPDESINYEEIISDLEAKIDKYELDVEANRNEKNTCETNIQVAISNISNYSYNLSNKDKELIACKNELQGIGEFENYKDYLFDSELIERYKEAIENYNKSNNYYVEYFNRNLDLEGKEKEELEKLIEVVEQNDNAKNIKLDELAKIKMTFDMYNSRLAEIEEHKNKSNKKIELYERLQRLSRISNGDNRLKMSFEKYVLAIYFEDVINYANEILKRLTDRYVLVRRDTLAKGNAQQGLDIDVYDFDTSARRSVKTLSGGETFKASLALALGLSEMIKQRKSLIEINTMFIDEGFGTLDSESLDCAINMLVGLKEQGQKIGIISHVAELKQRINAKIIVSRTNDGSNVRVVGE